MVNHSAAGCAPCGLHEQTHPAQAQEQEDMQVVLLQPPEVALS
jgi:hypothetical protein